MDIGPNTIRVAVGPIGSLTFPNEMTHLNDATMSVGTVTASINNLIAGATERNLASAIGAGINIFQQESSVGMGIPKLMVVVTHGPSKSFLETKLAAGVAVITGIDTIAVGVGSNIDQTELNFIAKDSNHVVTMSSFTGLAALDISERLCQGRFSVPYLLYVL